MNKCESNEEEEEGEKAEIILEVERIFIHKNFNCVSTHVNRAASRSQEYPKRINWIPCIASNEAIRRKIESRRFAIDVSPFRNQNTIVASLKELNEWKKRVGVAWHGDAECTGSVQVNESHHVTALRRSPATVLWPQSWDDKQIVSMKWRTGKTAGRKRTSITAGKRHETRQ